MARRRNAKERGGEGHLHIGVGRGIFGGRNKARVVIYARNPDLLWMYGKTEKVGQPGSQEMVRGASRRMVERMGDLLPERTEAERWKDIEDAAANGQTLAMYLEWEQWNPEQWGEAVQWMVDAARRLAVIQGEDESSVGGDQRKPFVGSAPTKNGKSEAQRRKDMDIEAVWQKGSVAAGYDAGVWRRDVYGAVMKRSEYGNRNSEYGWEVDHITPVSQGGGDHISNLRPLNWKNNVAR